ncbi:MAG TPA: hypothetical protein VM934_05685 [Pyrinomonadaceae bacterium]|jgi:hypothetical protein|nr:hypothetical protein [Pyrinomonadaceae bacterium]
MADPARLTIQGTGALHPFAQKYDIYYTNNSAAQRVNLCGFSFFGEIGGINLGSVKDGDKAIDLRGPGDPAPNPRPVAPKYSLTFTEYLDKLHAARINWVRIFVFHGYRVRVYPFTGSFAAGFNLHEINGNYITRLVDFIDKARARGIVVCITLFTAQAFSSGGLIDDPFHAKNNNNDVIVNPRGIPVDDGRPYFCDIEQPPGKITGYNPDWPQKQKLWWIQWNLVNSIVNATKDYWNVAYEIMNEPSAGITNVVPWCVTVASWLRKLLWDSAANRRSRLVAITASDNLIDNADPALRLIDHLHPTGAPPLYDIFCFHGGGGNLPSQWGGPHGRGRPRVCGSTQAPDVSQIVNGADEIIDDKGTRIHHNGIIDAMKRFIFRPVALIFDTDAQYWAQKNVTPYVEEVLNVDGSYNYRWADTFLNAVNDANCADLTPLRLGLDQRLAKISAARNKDRITVFR